MALISVKILVFASARDIVGKGELNIELQEGGCAADVLERLVADHPPLAAWKQYIKLAVNSRYAAPSAVLSNGDEVALIPPVSGG